MSMPNELIVNGETWARVSSFHPFKTDGFLSEGEVFALRYAALDMLSSLEEYVFPLHWEELDKMNAIQDSELYLWNFEGLLIADSKGDGYLLKTMGINADPRRMICVNVWRGEEDGWYIWN